jgi:hypothetical protein
MSRTEETFAATWKDLEWSIKHHKKPAWLVPLEDGYRVSFIKPDSGSLPFGTTSNLYDVELNIVDSIPSSKICPV